MQGITEDVPVLQILLVVRIMGESGEDVPSTTSVTLCTHQVQVMRTEEDMQSIINAIGDPIVWTLGHQILMETGMTEGVDL